MEAEGCRRGCPTRGTAREASHAIVGFGGCRGKSMIRSACEGKGADPELDGVCATL